MEEKHYLHKAFWKIPIKTDVSVNDYFHDILHF